MSFEKQITEVYFEKDHAEVYFEKQIAAVYFEKQIAELYLERTHCKVVFLCELVLVRSTLLLM